MNLGFVENKDCLYENEWIQCERWFIPPPKDEVSIVGGVRP